MKQAEFIAPRQKRKKLRTRILILAILLTTGGTFILVKRSQAQVHVDNKAFDTTLATMLAHDVPEVDVKMLAKDSDVVLLDARSREEYEVSHMKNAIWVGYDDFQEARLAGIPKNAHVVVYCAVGYRSEKIAEKMREAGYTDAANLYGGIFEWVNEGHGVVDMNGNPTQKVHAYDKTWGIWLERGQKIYSTQ